MFNPKYAVSDVSRNYNRLTFNITLIKDRFQASMPVYVTEPIDKFYADLESFISDERKEFDLRVGNDDSNEHLKIVKLDDLGHFSICGQFGCTWHDDQAKLGITVDQTDLHHILNTLKSQAPN